MYKLNVVLPAMSLVSMAMMGKAQAETCHFSTATSCNGVCIGTECNVDRTYGTGSGELYAVSVFTDASGFYPSPPGVSSHHWEVWGTDTDGNTFCCVMNPNTQLDVIGSPQADFLYLNYDYLGTPYDLKDYAGAAAAYVYGDGVPDPELGDPASGGDDEIEGSNALNVTDYLYGQAGYDYIWGYGGNGDQIYGGDDEDWLSGGPGTDYVYGGDGPDHIAGGGANDPVLDGGTGDDEICGGAGNDILFGQEGDDVLFGGPGDDWLIGGTLDEVSGDSCETDDGGIYGPDTCDTTGVLACPFASFG